MANCDDIERLFKAHYADLCRLALALVHDESLAADIVHDVFAALLKNGTGVLANAAYLRKAVRHRCLNHIRDCAIHQRIANRFFVGDEEYEDEDWPDEETIAQINDAIGCDVSPQARRVIALRFEEGLPFSKIALSMGISETAVYRHLSNALKIIRNKLKENG